MKSLLRRIYRMPVFMATLWSMGPLARMPICAPLVRGYMRLLARLVFWAFEGKRTTDVEELGREWRRLMPPGENFPVLESDGRTAVGGIHLHCSLRGTNNAHACHRLMQFDRSLVEAMGGELVVIQSQSRGGTACRVAMRLAGADWSDVTAAHEQP